MAKKESTKQPANKTPELAAAKKALETYLKDNKLDPEKDWTKDKKHGKKVTELINKLNKERDKAAAKFPESDPKTMKHLEKLAKHEIISKEKKMKKSKHMAEEAAAAKAEKSEKKPATAKKSTKYDYPLIDGREMTSAEKKKYRMEQRKLAAGDQPKEKKAKKEAPAKEEVKAPKKDKAAKKASKEKSEKPSKTKKEKKAKKTKKEED